MVSGVGITVLLPWQHVHVEYPGLGVAGQGPEQVDLLRGDGLLLVAVVDELPFGEASATHPETEDREAQVRVHSETVGETQVQRRVHKENSRSE